MKLWQPFNKIIAAGADALSRLASRPFRRIIEHGVNEGSEVLIQRFRPKSGSVYTEDRVRIGPNAIHAYVVRHEDGSVEDLGVHPNTMTWIGGTVMDNVFGFQPAGTTLASYVSSAVGATSITDTGTLMTASALSTPQIGLAGTRVYATPHTTTNPLVWGNVVSNSTSVITIDRWWKFAAAANGVPITGTTPTVGDSYVVAPNSLGGLQFIGLTNSALGGAGDLTLGSEITTNGLGRAMAVYAHTQSKTAFNALTLSNTFTASGTQSCLAAGLFSTLSSAGADPLFFEGSFTSASLINLDTLAITWSITLSG
jgi:hypothetical protein